MCCHGEAVLGCNVICSCGSQSCKFSQTELSVKRAVRPKRRCAPCGALQSNTDTDRCQLMSGVSRTHITKTHTLQCINNWLVCGQEGTRAELISIDGRKSVRSSCLSPQEMFVWQRESPLRVCVTGQTHGF